MTLCGLTVVINFSSPPGLPSNRLEPPTLSDVGEGSHIGPAGGPTIGEPISPSDIPTEEPVEKER